MKTVKLVFLLSVPLGNLQNFYFIKNKNAGILRDIWKEKYLNFKSEEFHNFLEIILLKTSRKEEIFIKISKKLFKIN